MATTKLKKKTKAKLKTEDSLALVDDYAQGKLTVTEIAKKYNTSEENVGLIVTRFWTSLTNMKESRALLSPTKDARKSLSRIRGTEQINTKFLEKLSDDTSETLSEAESVYCWIYVHTGDAVLAIEEAKLNLGIIKGDRKSRMSYDKAILIRSLYLNAKPNVAAYIKELRERRFIDQDVSKSRIQLELLEQLEQMKEQSQVNRKEILRVIELLGKTVGAFVERVEVSEIDPSKALDRLIELAKEAEVTTVVESIEVTS